MTSFVEQQYQGVGALWKLQSSKSAFVVFLSNNFLTTLINALILRFHPTDFPSKKLSDKDFPKYNFTSPTYEN